MLPSETHSWKSDKVSFQRSSGAIVYSKFVSNCFHLDGSPNNLADNIFLHPRVLQLKERDRNSYMHNRANRNLLYLRLKHLLIPNLVYHSINCQMYLKGYTGCIYLGFRHSKFKLILDDSVCGDHIFSTVLLRLFNG